MKNWADRYRGRVRQMDDASLWRRRSPNRMLQLVPIQRDQGNFQTLSLVHADPRGARHNLARLQIL